MSDAPGSRPDPDALLRRVQAEEVRSSRAKLRIFFGFAPGVGKTYRMLEVARSLVAEGVDVVVGAVETHQRKETADLLEGLEVLPRKQLTHRGRTLEEFDLDAALARRPAVLLLDELAHTNAPGSRHDKRWQDLIELLDAGIDVYSTLNVQHVESLNDVIAQITRVVVRETVPDSVLDRADAVEIVDISPEELLGRLRDGKVYLGEQAERAAQHFFQRGNLLALRELALRRTAERVDADVVAYRSEHGVEKTWATADRILVCVGPAPASARLVRAARRMAAGGRASWVAAYVDAPTRAPLLARDRARLDAHLQLAESLGASVVRLVGVRASEAILGYARKHNVTRIVIGKPTHSRLRDLLRGSMLDEIVRGSGDIDVHVITGDQEGGVQAPPAPSDAPRTEGASSWPGYGWSALVMLVTSALAFLARDVLGVPDVEMLYLLGVMIAASFFGRGPAVASAALGVALFDLFFVEPRFTFAVADSRYVLTFGMMFAVGLVLSSLTARLRTQEREALAREARTATLYSLSRDLAAAGDDGAVAVAAVRHASDAFGAPASVFAADGGGVRRLAPPPSPEEPEARADLGVVRWTADNARIAGVGTDTLPGAAMVCAPLVGSRRTLGVVALEPREALSGPQRELFEALARQVALALDRVQLGGEARRALLRAEAEALRSTLLSAVSHDLRTPLAAITAASTAIRDDPALEVSTRAMFVDTICDEAERLERLVGNLLEMTRLASGDVTLKRAWLPLDELVGAALAPLERRLRDRPVEVDLPDEMVLVSLDPVLAERLFSNLLENAAKHTPTGTPITIAGRRRGDDVVIEVSDRGPGLPPGEEERIFERFHRGSGVRSDGVGLGLAIARAIAVAHDARLEAENREGGGATFRLTVPPPSEAPPSSEAGVTRPVEDCSAPDPPPVRS